MKKFPRFSKDVEMRHNGCRKDKILGKLSVVEFKCSFCPVQKAYLNDIRKFIEHDGLIASPKVIKRFACKIEKKYLDWLDEVPKHIARVNDVLEEENVFDYENFRDLKGRGANGWGGSLLMKEILKTTHVCPYCNCDIVYAIEFEKARENVQINVKSAFDHAYPKGRYPFLSLCLYNLLPSCYRCNSQFKRDNFRDSLDSFHPYIDDVDDAMVFVPRNMSPEVWQGKKDSKNVVIDFCCREAANSKAATSYNRLFRLPEVYTQLYKEKAVNIVQKAKVCCERYTEQVDKWFSEAGIEGFDSFKFLYGIPDSRDEIDKHLLAKLTLDMIDMVRQG